MNWFTRLSRTLGSSIERVVAPLENHDAVVEAALREASRAVARAKVRLGGLQRESAQLETQRARLEEDALRWTARAKEFASTDQESALESLKRRRALHDRAQTLRTAIAAHADTTARLVGDITAAEQRIGVMNQQRHLLRTRESAAEALSRVADVELPTGELTQTLERWEVRIAETELTAGTAASIDPLERACVATEERSSLLAELEALTMSEESNHVG